MKQVLKITNNGAIKGLEHKGRCLDLKQFGKAVVERITSIEWDSELQGWYIRWEDTEDTRLFSKAGKIWGREEYAYFSEHLASMTLKIAIHNPSGTVLFKSYNDAVEIEVLVIQHLQKIGWL
jgi:hypothetical protein